jgi:hypothetical protein
MGFVATEDIFFICFVDDFFETILALFTSDWTCDAPPDVDAFFSAFGLPRFSPDAIVRMNDGSVAAIPEITKIGHPRSVALVLIHQNNRKV